ncbi:DUF2314 domain-containing protein [Roseiconus lacunae]|uniref:DUF2314 domain-containing protein n=1 Tax=Roseiconus lacunae TaxID=2605694 RepID=A0ABT7PE26_9BACT|nr:DUF2314 domain-containing protein [Roseiconus lacunae]MCD0463698.1 DUF2314 domain-containing protein [Roseiconus lacunae]MDM4014736.1 DUF2314 domain-containing protein [Roseiconus lacunae]WRQ50326.1 DUF2314 domain-containing protein [Stieleria sp. HD01]
MSASESPVFTSPSDDPEMEKAAQKARHSFRFFWREMAWERRRIIPALELAAVKGTFSDPPELKSDDPDALEVEHMWLMDVDFDGREVEGTLINSPISLQSVKEGDRVKIRGKQICDWMYVVSGEVYGGFTVDLLRSRMGKGERKQHDNAWGFDFGEVGVINLVPPDYIGEGTPAKKGIFSFGKPKSQQQDYSKVAAAEHPMSINMRTSLAESIDENPEMITQADDHGYNFLHQLALAGSLDGVDVCIEKGFDPKDTAPNGMTPYSLAKSLGWKKVMERLEQAGAA